MSRTRARNLVSIIAVTFWKSVGMGLSLVIAVGFANLFGATAATDAYFFVRRIVSNLAMVLERTFHMLHVPPLVQLARSAGMDALRTRLRSRSGQILAATVVPVGIAFIYAPELITLLAPGFSPDQVDRAVPFFRILVVTLPISAVTALSGATLNALGLFSMPVVARLLPRIFVVAALALVPLGFGLGLVASALVAGTVAMGLIFAIAIRRVFAARKLVTTTKLTNGSATRFSGYRLAAIIVAQVHVLAAAWIDMAFATTVGTGSVAILEFGQRLVNMSPGVVTNSVILVYYTAFARALADGDYDAFRGHITGAMRMTLVIILPIAVALFLLAAPIVETVFAHGAFDAAAAQQTALIVAILAPLLPINALLGTVVSAVFADARLPHLTIIAGATVAAMAVRVGLDLALIDRIGLVAVPLASFAAMATLLLILWACLTAHVGTPVPKREVGGFLKVIAATAVAGLAIWTIREFGAPYAMTRVQLAVLVGAAVSGGAVVFLAVGALLRLPEIGTLMAEIARLRAKYLS